MTMQIYNSLLKKKEEFKPQNPPHVSMYVCGPTVYDYFHIGNARSFVMADIVRRYLEYKGYDVKYVMNMTDIDDKIIKKANEEGISTYEVAEKYSKAFIEDITNLKIKEADVFPRATDHVNEIIEMIKKLEEKDYAYNADGEVFYDVKHFEGYGKLSGKDVDQLESGARIEVNEAKKNPLDFSLWKKAKKGEPAWDSPWGKGRPGWHIECSAMSTKHLGETIDIHAGGTDLIFPHHENEIAQSEGACGHQFVKYWIHFGFLNIQDEKMSKSLGNFFTAREILKKFPPEAIRLLFNQAHYRSPLNFTDELLETNRKALEKFDNFLENLSEGEKAANGAQNPSEKIDEYYKKFEEAMDDDFNTPKAVAVVFDFMRDMNKIISENGDLSKEFFQTARKFLEETAEGVLGIVDFGEKKDEGRSLEKDLIELLINIRWEAKQNKNFELADKIRDELSNLGVVLKDSKTGTTYKKVR